MLVPRLQGGELLLLVLDLEEKKGLMGTVSVRSTLDTILEDSGTIAAGGALHIKLARIQNGLSHH